MPALRHRRLALSRFQLLRRAYVWCLSCERHYPGTLRSTPGRTPRTRSRNREGDWSTSMEIAESRYRTLLNASTLLADQPTIKAVLSSLRTVLSSTSKLHGTELYVLDNDGTEFLLL